MELGNKLTGFTNYLSNFTFEVFFTSEICTVRLKGIFRQFHSRPSLLSCVILASSACDHLAPFQVTLTFVFVLHTNLSICVVLFFRCWLLWIESLWIWGWQTICDNALEKDYGILDICACVYVCAWPCGSGGVLVVLCFLGLFFGLSNPFKSASLIPLSSHSCCGFMQAHTSVPTAVHMGCISLQKNWDIVWNMLVFWLLRKREIKLIYVSCLCSQRYS